MTWNYVMGIISSVALFCPVFLILILRLGAYRTFPALIIYYSSVFIYNLMTEGHIAASSELIQYWGLVNNLADAPLMLIFLLYFSTTLVFAQRMKMVIASYVLFEVIVLSVKGFNIEAITIILGPGIILVLGFCIYFFIRHAKMAILHRKAAGKALMAAALLFGYGCFGIIYLMYYIFKTPFIEDTFLVYFIAVTVSSLLMSIGIIVEEKRIKKLNELKITRRELMDIYADEEKAAPLRRTAMLDFDREQWN